MQDQIKNKKIRTFLRVLCDVRKMMMMIWTLKNRHEYEWMDVWVH